MENLKIGQEIIITEDFEIKTCLGDNKITVKKGDKGFIDSKGFVHYTTGEARGKIQAIKDSNIKGYDTENIALLIYKRLSGQFEITEFLDDYDIPKKEFIDEIEEVLMEIL